ncbi:Zinc knuckle CX2CX4HX4C [Arabidopsis thaliana x Arabidopsis arenosa]|uniref:Zinc knuckle CX2CX4HX4C n=1 Tax=Arabidopsis thaliana x Arabidopsis arenosa TaxID=1240361 RepID=A0A8T1XMY3_9BRAS|nr:Zinc knuckle CX2CX4HX4C [Arabidopsis thaliana x Arabidopsis arenosa]
MSSAMDRALMEMSLEDKDEPFDMPDLPEFLSCERNKFSLIGRVLNPDCQPMKHLIRNMPRKWQKEGRVKGVALTSEKFQFIFDSKHDLEDVLAKGVHTFNEWTIVVDRWYENPPDDYLRFMFLWVQIWNIPVNYYTVKAITALGDLIGEVKEVVFDPDLPQVQEFVRVKVLFDVSRPLRRSKVIKLKNGETATVNFHYERVQKRCYECQRLTHEKEVCPILVKAHQDQATARRKGQPLPKPPPSPVLKESDPLFGVLKESQVGLDPNTGRPRIAQVSSSRSARSSIKDSATLEVMKPTETRDWLMEPINPLSINDAGNFLAISQPFSDSSTVYRPGLFEAGSSGTTQKKPKQRHRPPKIVRKPKPKDLLCSSLDQRLTEGSVIGTKDKRKAVGKGPSTAKFTKLNPKVVVPNEGPLMEMRRAHFPEVLFLMETKNCSNVVVDLQEWLGYERVFTVNPIGLSGGLALMWKKGVVVDIKYADKNLIDFHLQFGSFDFFVSCVYGDPTFSSRPVVWERLSRIGINRKEPWCMLGDFNAIMHNGEKLGGPRRGDSSFLPFKDMLESCDMLELPSKGNPFTWGGKRSNLWIQSRLDRSFGNKNWFRHFPVSNQEFLDKRGSDHRPVLVRLTTTKEEYRGHFRITQARAALEVEQSAAFPSTFLMQSLRDDLCKANQDEETFWSQKSRAKWMHGGDKNSKFFHASVKDNRGKQHIDQLCDVNGNMHKDEKTKGDIAAAYFKNLFKSSNQSNFQDLFLDFIPRVTEGMNSVLTATISKKEVREAVFAIKSSSAPGADGFTGFFFQKYWKILEHQVTLEIQQFFISGVFPKDWNFTQLCLIPKIKKPVNMTDLRPISLCSVLYKIISKILVRRLQPFLPELVSPNQSAFVADRLISDNILIAHEVVHGLRTHRKVSEEFMAIKSDMSKAFDRVEWNYVRALLVALGFHPKWVQWIMFTITSVSFTVLINDKAYGNIIPSRGLRQGDPLSPFLFVLCSEGLTHLMNRAERQGLLSGIRFSPTGPAIHHLLFADDSLFMCKADKEEVSVMKNIFKVYGEATGQRINFDKSSLTFGALIEEDSKAWIKTELGITNEGGAGTYLGLPECFSGSKIQLLDYIKDKLRARLSGWFARTLSMGGKEILLKAVAMAMPVYAMSCFKLTKTTCQNLTSAMSDFWWNALEHERKTHWVSWEKMCLSKELGGLGFRDIESFNQALLAKQAWRLLQNPSSLFARFFKSRYFDDEEFLEAEVGARPSYAWRSILHGRELVIKGLRKEVGNGNSISVWMDPWIHDIAPRLPFQKHFSVNLNLKVSDLIDFDGRCWNRDLLDHLFYPADVELIVKKKPVIDMADFWVWLHTKTGDFSVKSGYWLAFQSNKPELIREANQLPSTNGLKEMIWSTKTAPKIKMFIWRILSAALPVADQIIRRGMSCDPRCQVCGEVGESINHVLFTCSLARQIWALSGVPTPEFGFQNGSIFANIQFLFDLKKNGLIPDHIKRSWPWVLWRLWKNRNKLFFEGLIFCPLKSFQKIQEDTHEWFLAQTKIHIGDSENFCSEEPSLHCWDPPPSGWLKCNIGASWSGKKRLCGGAWVLRNEQGEVLLHSRRAFGNLCDKKDVMLTCVTWAVESMHSHKFSKVLFAFEPGDLSSAFARPIAWPSFASQVSDLTHFLEKIGEWKVSVEKSTANRGASLIAQSVVKEDRFQSYVASGHPHWLRRVFEVERISS